MAQDTRIIEILRQAKKLAQEYRALTGKPLGITGEVAEYEAARTWGSNLQLPARPDTMRWRKITVLFAGFRLRAAAYFLNATQDNALAR